jgi:hypothetical protein
LNRWRRLQRTHAAYTLRIDAGTAPVPLSGPLVIVLG